MNDLFRPYLCKYILVFFVMPFWFTAMETHQEHVVVTLEVLRKNRLYLNHKKCEFGQLRVSYVGYIKFMAEAEADLKKVRAMIESPQPVNLRELRGFLGLMGYCRKLVAGYATIAWPLTEQLNADNFSGMKEPNKPSSSSRRQ